eukprot:gene40132-30929_t
MPVLHRIPPTPPPPARAAVRRFRDPAAERAAKPRHNCTGADSNHPEYPQPDVLPPRSVLAFDPAGWLRMLAPLEEERALAALWQPGRSLVDIGAGHGMLAAFLAARYSMSVTALDVADSVDAVSFFSAARVARRWILVQEDNETPQSHARNVEHDPYGTFRRDGEWKRLFGGLRSFRLRREGFVGQHITMGCCVAVGIIGDDPRCFQRWYVLERSSGDEPRDGTSNESTFSGAGYQRAADEVMPSAAARPARHGWVTGSKWSSRESELIAGDTGFQDVMKQLKKSDDEDEGEGVKPTRPETDGGSSSAGASWDSRKQSQGANKVTIVPSPMRRQLQLVLPAGAASVQPPRRRARPVPSGLNASTIGGGDRPDLARTVVVVGSGADTPRRRGDHKGGIDGGERFQVTDRHKAGNSTFAARPSPTTSSQRQRQMTSPVYATDSGPVLRETSQVSAAGLRSSVAEDNLWGGTDRWIH